MLLDDAPVSHPGSAFASLVLEAGHIIMYYKKKGVELNPSPKKDGSPITLADRASHEFLVKSLKKYSNFPVISEEGDEAQRDIHSWEKDVFLWLVDPLDGTEEFIKGNDHFTVNIALLKNQEPCMGIIGIPAENKVIWAQEGQVWEQTPHGCKILEVPHCEEKLLLNPKTAEKILPGLENLPDPIGTLILRSSLKFCWLALGKASLSLTRTKTYEWDTAAGHHIIKTLGGNIITQNGNPLLYRKNFWTNPSFLAFCPKNAHPSKKFRNFLFS